MDLNGHDVLYISIHANPQDEEMHPVISLTHSHAVAVLGTDICPLVTCSAAGKISLDLSWLLWKLIKT